MYDRAPRPTANYLVGSTKDNVGPGTYDPPHLSAKWVKSDGYAPFLSMSGRETMFHVDDSVMAAPGPGAYDPRDAQKHVKGGRTLANRQTRFSDVPVTNQITPGPGRYNLSKKSDWIKSAGTIVKLPIHEPEQVNISKAILTSRVRYQRQPDAPSIPSPGKAYGYEETEDGTLRKQAPPPRDESMGPAFYKPGHVETLTTAKYKGVHFGTLRSKRLQFSGSGGPGPGDYNPYKEEGQKAADITALVNPDGRPYEARLPRYHEIVVQEEEKKAVPGPGKYEIQGQFTHKPPPINTEGLEVEHPPFMSQAKRFTGDNKSNPAPGSYNDPRNALEALKKITGMKRSPFGQTAVRFTPQTKTTKFTPGPGAYNIFNYGLAQDSLKKAFLESTRRGVFGTTSPRVVPIVKKHEVAGPGPSHYQPKSADGGRQKKQLTSTFASLTDRLSSPVAQTLQENPPPGSYEVAQSFKHSQDKRNNAPPRNKEAYRRNRAFLSSSDRFAIPRDIIIDKAEKDVPGPGTYEHKEGDANVKLTLMVTKDKRFKREFKDEVPGPGAYELSPLLANTMLQGTFNATLHNPVAPAIETGRASTNKQAFLLGV